MLLATRRLKISSSSNSRLELKKISEETDHPEEDVVEEVDVAVETDPKVEERLEVEEVES